jgi:hypothetical protein
MVSHQKNPVMKIDAGFDLNRIAEVKLINQHPYKDGGGGITLIKYAVGHPKNVKSSVYIRSGLYR